MSQEAPDFNPNRINEIDPTRIAFPQRYLRDESLPAPPGAEVEAYEETADEYVHLEQQYVETQRALSRGFDIFSRSTMNRSDLEEAARPYVDAINEHRAGYYHEPKEGDSRDKEAMFGPLAVEDLSDSFLRHAARPEWQAYIPEDGSEEAEQRWEGLKARYPEHMQANLDELRLLDGKLRILSKDETIRTEVMEMDASRAHVMRAAATHLSAERKNDLLEKRIAAIYMAASASDRMLTSGEQKRITHLQEQQAANRSNRNRYVATADRQQLQDELQRRRNLEYRRQFERGIVMTPQMEQIIDQVLPSLSAGKPALFVGDTGGAKTALAEYISHEYFGTEPEFISGYADVNSYQVVGKMSLKAKDGSTVSEFSPGPLIRAMEEGKPVILDEVNAMPPEFLKRLNKIMQLRPGDIYEPQEDSGRRVEVKPGFVIIATANEKSRRYKGVDSLSTEFKNRFGGNTIRVHYPDYDLQPGYKSRENAAIAYAAMADHTGKILEIGGIKKVRDTSKGPGKHYDYYPVLEEFIQMCQKTQEIFDGRNLESYSGIVSSERILEGKPGLDDEVLAPRTMVALLEKVRDSKGRISLDEVIRSYVEGIESKNDRDIMRTLAQGHGFLRDPESDPSSN